jgi:hypothetical protein
MPHVLDGMVRASPERMAGISRLSRLDRQRERQKNGVILRATGPMWRRRGAFSPGADPLFIKDLVSAADNVEDLVKPACAPR